MPTSPRPCDTLPLARSLLRLARSGAYARPSGDLTGSYHVLSPRNGFAAPVALLPQAVVADALAFGWLTAGGANGELSLSRQGRRVIKRAITNTSHAVTSRAPSAPRAPRSEPAGAGSSRGPQRIESPLLWLRNRKDRSGRPLITQAQYEAGTRLAADHSKGQMQARVTASWSVTAPCLRAGTPGAGVDISDAALAARNRFHAAIDAVGPEMGHLLIDVCCHDIGLEAAERARKWPVRSGKVVLDMGLTALARHYGFERAASDASAPLARTGSRRWSDPAFTPTLARWEHPPEPAANRGADATASL